MSAELIVILIYAGLAAFLLVIAAAALVLRRRRRRWANAMICGWVWVVAGAGYGIWRADSALSESATALLWFFFYTPALAVAAFLAGMFVFAVAARRSAKGP